MRQSKGRAPWILQRRGGRKGGHDKGTGVGFEQERWGEGRKREEREEEMEGRKWAAKLNTQERGFERCIQGQAFYGADYAASSGCVEWRERRRWYIVVGGE